MPFNKISHYQLFPRCYAINLYRLSHCFEVQKEKNAFSLYTAGNELLKVLYDFESYMSTGRLSHTTAPGYFRYTLLCIYPNLPLVVDFVDQSVGLSSLGCHAFCDCVISQETRTNYFLFYRRFRQR